MSGFPASLGILSFVYGNLPSLSLRALALLGSLFFFRRTCYGSVKNGFDSAILTKIPGMKKEEGLGSSVDDPGAKRQARTSPVTTPQHSNSEGY